MSFSGKDLRLYAVTDRSWLGAHTLAEQVERALSGGVTCLQLREKDAAPAEFLEEAETLLPLCRRYGVPFIVNDSVGIALECGADGIHIGQGDAPAEEVRARIHPGMILGVSVHTVGQAVAAQNAGADYLGVGAVFPTGTKTDAHSVSYKTLREICAAVSVPVVAIGGINLKNVRGLAGSGIAGIAVVSAVFAAADIRLASAELLAVAEEVCG